MFCRSCGKQLDDNVKFCKYCGAKLGTSTQNQQQEEETVILPKNQSTPAPMPKMAPPPQAPKMPPPPQQAPKMPPLPQQAPKMSPLPKAPTQQMKATTKKKSGGSVVIIIEIIIVVILLIAIAIGAVFLFKDGKMKGIGNIKTGKGIEKNENLEETSASDEENTSLGYEEALENGEFEDAILTILDLDEDVIAEHTDEVKDAFEKALEGHLQATFTNVDDFIGKDEYVDAYDALDDELSYREEIEKKFTKSDLPEDISFEADAIEEQRAKVNEKYMAYAISEADAASDIADAQAIFRDADKYISGDDYEAEKTKVFTHIVLAKLGSMQQKGENASTAKAYVVNNLSLVDNNCWVLEFWDYFNAVDAMNGVYTVPEGKVTHISSDGYILPDSATRELSESDIAGFSKMECRLARFEIYARHGRGFNDAAITKFFSNYTWYHEQISYDKFDESTLTEVERKNRDLIVQYERQQGYL